MPSSFALKRVVAGVELSVSEVLHVEPGNKSSMPSINELYAETMEYRGCSSFVLTLFVSQSC